MRRQTDLRGSEINSYSTAVRKVDDACDPSVDQAPVTPARSLLLVGGETSHNNLGDLYNTSHDLFRLLIEVNHFYFVNLNRAPSSRFYSQRWKPQIWVSAYQSTVGSHQSTDRSTVAMPTALSRLYSTLDK